MSSCVGTAPRWSLGSCGSFACRGYLQRCHNKARSQSRRLTPVSTSSPRDLSATICSQSFPRDVQAHGLNSCITHRPHEPVQTHQRKYIFQFHTTTHDAYAQSPLSRLPRPATVGQKELDERHDVTQSYPDLSSGYRDNNMQLDQAPYRKAPSPSPFAHRLPNEFGENIQQISSLMSKWKDISFVRAQLSQTIDIMDGVQLKNECAILKQSLHGGWNHKKARRASRLLISGILTSPHHVLRVLRLLHHIQFPFDIRHGCLALVGQIYEKSLLRDTALLAQFDAEVERLRSPHMWPRSGIHAEKLKLLLWRSTPEQLGKLVSDFVSTHKRPSMGTYLQLTMFCASNGMEDAAMSLLLGLPPGRLQSPNSFTLRCCQVLLRYDTVESTKDGPNFKYLPRLLEHGLTPDSILYSRIIERALASGYPAVAWDIFHHLQTTKMNITGSTYLFLLRHAYNEKNVVGVQKIMAEIHQQKALYRNVRLVHWSMNIVRRIFGLEKLMTTAESWSNILSLYDRVYDRKPLAKLDIVRHVDAETSEKTPSQDEQSREVIEPDTFSLSFVIWAHVLCHRHAKQVSALWTRIQHLVDDGDEVIVDCMRNDLIYNAFMWLHLRDKTTMAGALEILQYMLAKQFCRPTDRTWSILICGFLRQGQRSQAQRTYELMKQYELGLRDVRWEYGRQTWTFEYLEKNLETSLDEQMMLDGAEYGGAGSIRAETAGTQSSYSDLARAVVYSDQQDLDSAEFTDHVDVTTIATTASG